MEILTSSDAVFNNIFNKISLFLVIFKKGQILKTFITKITGFYFNSNFFENKKKHFHLKIIKLELTYLLRGVPRIF